MSALQNYIQVEGWDYAHVCIDFSTEWIYMDVKSYAWAQYVVPGYWGTSVPFCVLDLTLVVFEMEVAGYIPVSVLNTISQKMITFLRPADDQQNHQIKAYMYMLYKHPWKIPRTLTLFLSFFLLVMARQLLLHLVPQYFMASFITEFRFQII